MWQIVWRNENQDTSHMNKVDQSVSETDAKPYVHSMITEHSLSPAPNNWIIVPARLGSWVKFSY